MRGIVGASLAGLFIAVVIAPPRDATPARALTWLLFLGSAVHVASTGVLFSFPQVRAYAGERRTRFLLVPLMLVTAGAVLAGLAPTRVLSDTLLGYFGWQFFHYQKQNLGLAALAAASQRVPSLSQQERRAVLATGWCGIAALLARPGLLQLTVRVPALSSGVTATAAAGFALAVGYGVFALRRRDRTGRPSDFVAVYLVALAFPLPVFVFSSPYAAVGGMTIAHGLQYLVLVGTVAVGPDPRRSSQLRLTTLAIGTLLVGALLSAMSHLHRGDALARAGYGAYLGVVMTHFVVDAGVWRLRDGFPRAFLSARAPALLGAR